MDSSRNNQQQIKALLSNSIRAHVNDLKIMQGNQKMLLSYGFEKSLKTQTTLAGSEKLFDQSSPRRFLQKNAS